MTEYLTNPKIISPEARLQIKEAAIIAVQKDPKLWEATSNGVFDKSGEAIMEETIAKRMLFNMGMTLKAVLAYKLI